MTVIEKNIGFFTFMDDVIFHKIYFEDNQLNKEDFAGDVLYLGWGFNYLPRVMNSQVSSTTIIENSSEVITWNNERNNQNPNWLVIEEDAADFVTDQKFDTVVIDIWFEQISQEELSYYVDKYSLMLKSNGKLIYLPHIVK
jgi:cyclopropane fatty-acyl-phospholipid synthase-like methyltransferase